MVLCHLQMNAFRNAHKIHVLGSDIPDVIDSFERLAKMYGILPIVMKNVQTAGYAMPTPIQMQAIPLMLQVGCCMCEAVCNMCQLACVN